MMGDVLNRRLPAVAACLIGLAAALLPPGQGARLRAAPAPAPVNPEWTGAAFDDTCFLNWQSAGGLNEEQARRLLEAVPGQPFQLTQQQTPDGQTAVSMSGLARLRAPWAEGSVLRFSLHTAQPFRLHFWGPQGGVVLGQFRDQHRSHWAALGTSHRPGSPPPAGQERSAEDLGLALMATDDQRASRSPAERYEIRCQAGSLVMTQGDIRLLTVPMETPRDVYVEGQAALLRQLAMESGGPAPDDPIAPPKLVLDGGQPAALPWSALPAGAGHLQRPADGSIVLTMNDKSAAPTWIAMPLIRPGLYEVIVEIDAPSPESGVLLADQQGRPIQGVEFYRSKTAGLVAYRFGKPEVAPPAPPQEQPQPGALPGPYIGKRAWLKLVLGGGTLKCFTSADGLHWGQALPPLVQGGNAARVGLFCQPGSQPRRIGLRRLVVRQLDALMALAPVELEEQAEASPVSAPSDDLSDLAAWQVRVLETAPPGADLAAWRRACALATLVHGPEPPLAKALVEELLREGLAASMPLEGRLRLLEQATLLYDAWATEDAQRVAAHWDRLALAAMREGNAPEADAIRRARMTASLWTQNYRVEPLSAPLASEYLLFFLCRGQWIEADRACAQLRFWNQPADPGAAWPSTQAQVQAMVQWLEPFREKLAKRGGNPAPSDAPWLHPVSVEIGKEAFNVVTDLQSALDGGEYQHAYRVLTSAAFPADAGLAPDARDPWRFESPATAVGRMVRSHPRWQRTLNVSVGPLDSYRLSRAVAECDVGRIRSIAVQYYGTPVAAEALRWLGDRLMGGGEFAAAASCYEQALPGASAAQRRQLEPRLRLAGAMRGRRVGEPATGNIRLGDVAMPAAEFEQLVAEMLQEHAAAPPATPAPKTPQPGAHAPPYSAAFGPGQYRAEPRETIEGDWGAAPQNAPGPSQQVDWQARQLGAAAQVAGPPDVMLVANRFQVTAVDLKSGAQRWSYGLGAGQGPAHAWPLVPMRPLVWDKRVYVRLLEQNGRPSLFCLDLAAGKLLWKTRWPGEVVSDPVVFQDHLLVLTIDAPEQPLVTLLLTTVDPESGSVLGRKPLVPMGSQWTAHHACQVAAAGDKLLVAVAGALLCCDPFHDLLWVRREHWIPPALDDSWPRQYHQPPLIEGDRAYVAQVGCHAVECVNLATGELHWRQVLSDVRRILASAGGRVLVEADERLLAFSAKTGRPLWSHEAANLLDCHAQAGSGTLLYVRNEPLPNSLWCPVLVWVDVETGQAAGRSPLWSLKGRQPRLGPFVAAGERLFCLTGVFDEKGQALAKRGLVELVAQGPQTAQPATAPDFWTAQVDPGWPLALEKVLPGWTMLAGSVDRRTGLLSLARTKDGDLVPEKPAASPAQTAPGSETGPGAEDVLVTRAAEWPMRLARRLAIPEGKPQLVIEMGHDPESASRLEVMIDGIPRQSWPSKPTKTEKDWQTVQVDLSPVAGRTVWVLITQERTGGGAAYAYFKKIGLQQAP